MSNKYKKRSPEVGALYVLLTGCSFRLPDSDPFGLYTQFPGPKTMMLLSFEKSDINPSGMNYTFLIKDKVWVTFLNEETFSRIFTKLTKES